MDQLQAQIVALQEELVLLRTTHSSAAPQLPHMPTPDKFDGTRSKFCPFVNQCRLLMMLQASRFPSEQVKVGYVLSLLTGPALQWATPLIESNDQILHSFDSFMERFRQAFDDPDRTHTAELLLSSMAQGNRSCMDYASEFLRVAADLPWNDEAKM